jgi:hypothetical protein
MTINNVTYLSVLLNSASNKPYSDINSIVKLANCELADLNFASKRIYSFTKPTVDVKDVEIYTIDEVAYENFTRCVISTYPKMFDSEFMINFHCDGFIINPESWSDEFLEYDYIGAPFDAGGTLPPSAGNGGFSLRSKKFCEEVKDLYMNVPDQHPLLSENWKSLPEDFITCFILREDLIHRGIKFAPFEVASKFATEHLAYKDENFYNSFGFHEFSAVSNEDLEKVPLNVDKKYISKNSKEVVAMRKKIHQSIFNEN